MGRIKEEMSILEGGGGDSGRMETFLDVLSLRCLFNILMKMSSKQLYMSLEFSLSQYP